jgi:ABC-type maltose transport system permease subunit
VPLRRRMQRSEPVFKWVGIGVGTLTVLLIAFIVGSAFAPAEFRAGTRDIFIAVVSIFQLISAILMIAILFAILYVVNQLNKIAKTNVIPKVDDAMVKLNEVLDSTRSLASNISNSASTATQTTAFMAERVVSPIIRISSLVSGVRVAATTLARRDAPEQVGGDK